MNIEPLVSVVTPVYNGEKYLAECIESVLSQTYSNWEYIIVNNCSTDRTLEIAQNYARRESRIRVENNTEFVSAMQNHHLAFQYISRRSEYCKVVHADDLLFPECLTRMVEVAEVHPSVGIVGAYRLDDVRVNLAGVPYPSRVVPGREICRATLLGELYVFGSPTSLLIRSEILRQHKEFYDERRFPRHADTAACYEFLQSWDFGFVHQVLTFTRRHDEARTSYSQAMETYLAEGLKMLVQYGPTYLTKAEYAKRLDQILADYYQFLGKSLFKHREEYFWDYHQKALMEAGNPLRSVKLAQSVIKEIIRVLLHPAQITMKAMALLWKSRENR
jgi:glycosyltransferase involved in cell wall biosynthesis